MNQEDTMCEIRPFPPKKIGPGSALSLTRSAPAIAPDGTALFAREIDLRAVLPAPAATDGDSVAIAVSDVARWLRDTSTPPSIVLGATLDQAIQPTLNGAASPLAGRLSAWRQHLDSGGLIIAEMYVDKYFFAASDTLIGAERIVNAFDNQLSPVPAVRAVIVVGSYVDPLDKHPDHLSGRYLVRSGLGRSWGNDGFAWVAQTVASHRFIRGFAVSRP
jgi:hypothetical protein